MGGREKEKRRGGESWEGLDGRRKVGWLMGGRRRNGRRRGCEVGKLCRGEVEGWEG